MKNRTKGIIAVISGCVLTTSLVACGYHNKSPEEKASYMMVKISKKMELTETQVVHLEKLKNDLLRFRQHFVDGRDETHKTIDDLLSQPTLAQQPLVDLVQAHTSAVNKQAPTVVASMAGFYNSLNPEQQAMLRKRIAEHRQRRHKWHHRH